MTDFDRTTRQDEIWTELNEIRDTVDAGLLDPTDGEYAGDDLEALQASWDALVAEYVAIHLANDSKG